MRPYPSQYIFNGEKARTEKRKKSRERKVKKDIPRWQPNKKRTYQEKWWPYICM